MVVRTHPSYLRPYHQGPLSLPLRQPHPHRHLHLLNPFLYHVSFIRTGPQVTTHRDPSQDTHFFPHHISPTAAYGVCPSHSDNDQVHSV
jgi:hypothetical protein